ncbi:MAG TPA: fumarate hydratase C-terminal domain-containing protein, partial [Thermoleophilia bacterium]|nr:fumarate hydratase C-terminal domain-containing protein [Thermoleophilia bacterium]
KILHLEFADGLRAKILIGDDLGAEAIRELEVEDFPAVVVNDIYGGDAYQEGRAQFERKEATGT